MPDIINLAPVTVTDQDGNPLFVTADSSAGAIQERLREVLPPDKAPFIMAPMPEEGVVLALIVTTEEYTQLIAAVEKGGNGIARRYSDGMVKEYFKRKAAAKSDVQRMLEGET